MVSSFFRMLSLLVFHLDMFYESFLCVSHEITMFRGTFESLWLFMMFLHVFVVHLFDISTIFTFLTFEPLATCMLMENVHS